MSPLIYCPFFRFLEVLFLEAAFTSFRLFLVRWDDDVGAPMSRLRLRPAPFSLATD
jgi:hypothetical protein